MMSSFIPGNQLDGYDCRIFRYWYPDFSTYQRRRTFSYWISVLFLEGGIIFTASSMFALHPPVWGPLLLGLTAEPMAVGSFCYFAGAYCGLLVMTNLQQPSFRWTPVRATLHHLDVIGVGRLPLYASLLYCIGALMFFVTCTGRCLLPDPYLKLAALPNLIASTCFFAAGILVCNYNEVLKKPRREIVWWVSIFCFLGGVGFTFSAILEVCWRLQRASFYGSVVYMIGSSCMTIASFLMLVMWKNEQFGLILVSPLNKFSTSQKSKAESPSSEDLSVPLRGRIQHPEGRFSLRGLCFLCLYVMLACVSVSNFFFCFVESELGFHTICGALHELTTFVIMHMILVMHSACVKIPKHQPYHSLTIGIRWIVLMTNATSLSRFFFSLNNLHSPRSLFT